MAKIGITNFKHTKKQLYKKLVNLYRENKEVFSTFENLLPEEKLQLELTGNITLEE